MSFLLISLPPAAIEKPHLAMGYLLGSLKSNKIDYHFMDLNIELYHRRAEFGIEDMWQNYDVNWSEGDCFRRWKTSLSPLLEERARDIAGSPMRVIGIGANRSNHKLASYFAGLIKQRNPSICVVMGGPLFSSVKELHILDDHCADIFVRGEGEMFLPRLINALLEERSISGGNFINRMIANKQVIDVINGDIDAIPFPCYDNFDINCYRAGFLSMLASRGCVSSCAFCADNQIWKPYRGRSVDNILSEITMHYDHGFHVFEFNDSAINGNTRVLTDLCRGIIKSKIKLTWLGNFIPRKGMPRELFAIMAQSGCYELRFGVETGSQRIHRSMHKIVDLTSAEGYLRYAHEEGIHVSVNIMVGFPNEEQADFDMTLDFLERTKASIEKFSVVLPFLIYPMSEVDQCPERFGIKIPEDQHSRKEYQHWYTDEGNTLELRLQRLDTVVKFAHANGIQ